MRTSPIASAVQYCAARFSTSPASAQRGRQIRAECDDAVIGQQAGHAALQGGDARRRRAPACRRCDTAHSGCRGRRQPRPCSGMRGCRGRCRPGAVACGECVCTMAPTSSRRLEYVAMKAPFARWTAAAEPAPVKVHERNIVGLRALVGHAGRTDEEAPLIAAHTDIAGGAMGQPAPRELATARNHRLAQMSGLLSGASGSVIV